MSTADAGKVSPWDVPTLNVQMIAVASPEHGWYLCRSNDYYWYLPDIDEWQGGDIFGLWDYLAQPGMKRVLFGRTISNKDFGSILTRALNDPEIPQKTGWAALGEPRPSGAGISPARKE